MELIMKAEVSGKLLVGTCGNCGGPVYMPDKLLEDTPSRKCRWCGAYAKEQEKQRSTAYGPVLDMY